MISKGPCDPDNPDLQSLDSVQYILLQKLSEPPGSPLHVVVQEAVVNPAGFVQSHPELPELAEILKNSSPLESTDTCRSFELTWTRCVAYLVTDERVAWGGSYSDEVFTGNSFRVYTQSHFLGHLSRDTGSHLENVLHYKLICLNHVIDVAAYGPPEVRIIGPASSNRVLIQ